MTPPLKYSPKLKQAMAQIRTILREHDIAGAMVLHTPGYSEYYVHLTPTYSIMTAEPNQEGFRIKMSKEEQRLPENLQKLSDTCNMVDLLGTNMGSLSLPLLDLYVSLKELLEITNTDTSHTPDSEITN